MVKFLLSFKQNKMKQQTQMASNEILDLFSNDSLKPIWLKRVKTLHVGDEIRVKNGFMGKVSAIIAIGSLATCFAWVEIPTDIQHSFTKGKVVVHYGVSVNEII